MLDDRSRRCVALPGAKQNARETDAARLAKCGSKCEMTIASAAVTRRDVIADMAAVLREERSIDVVPQARYRNDGPRWIHKPAVRTRNPPGAQTDTALFVDQGFNIGNEANLRGRVDLGVWRIVGLEVSKHCQESTLGVRGGCDGTWLHAVGLTSC